MREIKFRAWDKEKKKMVTDFVLAPTSPDWSPFHYFTHTEIEKIRELLHSAFAFDPGLRDKIDPENQILSFIASDYTWFDWADYYGSEYLTIMQYTGLEDKNGLTEVYEGDIISPEGDVIGNIYEGKIRQGIDIVIERMGTKAWRNTEQKAIERGCQYAE